MIELVLVTVLEVTVNKLSPINHLQTFCVENIWQTQNCLIWRGFSVSCQVNICAPSRRQTLILSRGQLSQQRKF